MVWTFNWNIIVWYFKTWGISINPNLWGAKLNNVNFHHLMKIIYICLIGDQTFANLDV